MYCDYDLTGLSENRCPECGAPFDVAQLRRWLARAPKPIRWKALMFHLFILPGFFILANALAFAADQTWTLQPLLIAATIAIPFASFLTADRVLAARRVRRGQGPFARIRLANWFAFWITLVLIQTAACGAGSYLIVRLNLPLH